MKNRSLKKAVAAALAVTMSLSLYTAPVFAEETGSTEEVTMETSLEEEGAAVSAQHEAEVAAEQENATEEQAEGAAKVDSNVEGDWQWNFDEGTGTLTIKSANGKPAAMPSDYAGYSQIWHDRWDIWSYNSATGESTNGKQEIKKVVIDDSITSIGYNAFYYCKNLKEISIPSSVTKIESYAFSQTGLTSVEIPASVKEIGYSAFSSSNLKVKIQGDTQFKVGKWPSFGAVQSIDIAESNSHYTSKDGVVYSKDGKELLLCPSGKTSLVVADGTEKIGDYACNGLLATNIIFSDSVRSVGTRAFQYSSLNEVTFLNHVTTVGDQAFESCHNLKSITFPSSVQKIGSNILSGSTAKIDLKFVGNVPQIASDALEYHHSEWNAAERKLEDLVTANVVNGFYPKGNATWTADKLQNYGGQVTWTAYEPTVSKGYCSLNDEGGKWDGTHYYLPDGSMVVNSFFFDGEYTYYLQADGTPMKDRLTYHPDGEHIIYLDENGHEAFTNFVYCTSVGYICYFGSDGYLYKDQITFVGDKTYYLNANGAMEQNGWFQFANGLDYGFANSDGTLVTTGFSYDPYGRVVFYHWNGMVARGLISDGVYYYSMDETDGHYLGQFPVNQ